MHLEVGCLSASSLAALAASCNRTNHDDTVKETEASETQASSPQPLPLAAVSTEPSDEADIPKVRCDYSIVNEFDARGGNCIEYFVGPEESLQLDKAAELEAACTANGGMWDFDGCLDDVNIAGICATPPSDLEPAINEVFYREAEASGDDPRASCTPPSVWITKR